jgi:C_GCAxxG_C_C family probable redox protein
MSRAERAKEYFMQGYACSQAVALAFSDLTGLSEEQISKLCLPFGGGFGRQRLVCGAVSGFTVILGLLFAESEVSAENKKFVYALEQKLCADFKSLAGSLICNDLLTGANLEFGTGGEAENRTSEYYKKRPCAELVYIAAKVLEDYLEEVGKV